MSKILKLALLAITAIVLAACGSSTVGDLPAGGIASAGNSGKTVNANNRDALTEQQLVYGSLRLEQGEHSINAAQAGQLLPLWQAYQSLLQSDTAAQAEISALLAQIEGEMTAEQLAEIAAMEVDIQDIPGLMEELGLQLATDDGTGDGARFGGEGRPQGFPEGFVPGQGPGGGQGLGGGQIPGGGEGLSPEQIATFQAENPNFQERAGRGNIALIRPLILLLESKVG